MKKFQGIISDWGLTADGRISSIVTELEHDRTGPIITSRVVSITPIGRVHRCETQNSIYLLV